MHAACSPEAPVRALGLSERATAPYVHLLRGSFVGETPVCMTRTPTTEAAVEAEAVCGIEKASFEVAHGAVVTLIVYLSFGESFFSEYLPLCAGGASRVCPRPALHSKPSNPWRRPCARAAVCPGTPNRRCSGCSFPGCRSTIAARACTSRRTPRWPTTCTWWAPASACCWAEARSCRGSTT
jgi:hypothetical protein